MSTPATLDGEIDSFQIDDWVGVKFLKFILITMGQTYTSFHTALSKKLGWDAMPAKVALPAIDRVITNYLSHINDCTGDVLSPEEAATALLRDYWIPDEIFSLLVSPDYQEWKKEKALFASLRFEIEEWMRRGNSYEQSIAEWYK